MQIIVLGMHRSGTSAVARLLNLMGCYVGPEDLLMRASDANPRGHWERQDVTAANDRILEAMGGRWYDVGSLTDVEDLPEPTLHALEEELSFIILGLDAHRPWMIKDPRLCLVLPLWLRSLEAPLFILVHRDPDEVARSLHRRDGFPEEVGIALWEMYSLSSLRASTGFPRTLVRYDDLLARPVETVRRLRDWLDHQGVVGLRMPADLEITSFVDAKLQRSKRAPGEDPRRLAATQSVLRLYGDEDRWQEADVPALSEESRRILQLFGPVRQELEQAKEALAACNRRRDELSGFEERFHEAEEKLLAQTLLLEQTERLQRDGERQVRELEAALRDRDRMLVQVREDLNAAHGDLDAVRKDLNTVREDLDQNRQVLLSHEQRNVELERGVTELDGVVGEILGSETWRLGWWLMWPVRLLRGRPSSVSRQRDAILKRLAERRDT